METLYEPAEYVGVAECNECGEILDLDDIPQDAEVEEAKQRISFVTRLLDKGARKGEM
jgi:hypothetical protein